MPIYVPVHPALVQSITACPSPDLAINCKDDGTHYTKEGLGNFFREAIEAAGIPVTKNGSKEKGYSGHGLRKASATIAAESGATEAELNAMFGWSGHQMAQHYTKKADRKRLAARAMQKWTRPSSDVVWGKRNSHLQFEKRTGLEQP
jgi:integrase